MTEESSMVSVDVNLKEDEDYSSGIRGIAAKNCGNKNDTLKIISSSNKGQIKND